MAGPGRVLSTAALLLSFAHISAPTLTGFKIEITDRANSVVRVSNDGVTFYSVRPKLFRQLQRDAGWHWTPYLKTRTLLVGDQLQQECSNASSVESFPDGIFTDEQLRSGGFVLYILLGIYAFTLIAFVCNDYFIPSVEIICDKLRIPQNVAAATFMAVATSSPEFFVNTISTFLTESDMGIGTIVGSALFNALGVAAVGSLAAVRPIRIKKAPVIRDVIVYVVNVSVLVAIVWDGLVQWYEAVVLGVMYIVYFVIMFNCHRVFALVKRWRGKKEINKFDGGPSVTAVNEDEKPEVVVNGVRSTEVSLPDNTYIPMIKVDGEHAALNIDNAVSRGTSREVSFCPSLVFNIPNEVNKRMDVASTLIPTASPAPDERAPRRTQFRRLMEVPINKLKKKLTGSHRSISSLSSNSSTSFDELIKIADYRLSVSRSFTSSQALWPKDRAVPGDIDDSPWDLLWRFPKEKSCLSRFVWLYSWPIRLVLTLLVPSPQACARLYPVTFLMCILCIGANSYLVSWTMTVLGHVFYIPDSVMGMTFLAFGGCVPEACGIFIMSRRGEGGMGISNAIGANSLAILFALGLPWMIKTLTLLVDGVEDPVIRINSSGIDFVIGSLLVAVLCLMITLYIGKFTLKRQTGIVFMSLYVIFVTFAILVEMGVIFDLQMLQC